MRPKVLTKALVSADIEADDLPLAHAGEKVKGVLGMAFMQRSLNKQVRRSLNRALIEP